MDIGHVNHFKVPSFWIHSVSIFEKMHIFLCKNIFASCTCAMLTLMIFLSGPVLVSRPSTSTSTVGYKERETVTDISVSVVCYFMKQ